jgi:hypothetical protein
MTGKVRVQVFRAPLGGTSPRNVRKVKQLCTWALLLPNQWLGW